MYLYDYLWFMGALLICSIISIFASIKVNKTFAKYNAIPNRARMTGYDTAVRLMRSNGIWNISVGRVGGTLSDHYDPTKQIVNLSESTYGSYSIGAVAVAAHEMGHVMQKEKNYIPFKIRTWLVPIVNIGSRMALPLVLIGFLIDLFSHATEASVGFYIALAGVILYGTSFLFTLVTLPVELNASRRASEMLVDEGILDSSEIKGARKVLNAAALTYVASALTSLIYFLRFFVRVLTLFGRRNNSR